MKLTKRLIIVTALAAGSSFAATYTINNGSGATATGIADSSGNVFRGSTVAGTALGGTNGGTSAGPGVVGIGIFSTETLSSFTGSQLIASFTLFGTTGAFSASGPTGARGQFSLGEPAITIAGNSTFSGKNMFLFVGNGATYQTSSQFLVLKNTKTFDIADDAVPTGVTVTFTDTNSTRLFGSALADLRTTSTDTTTNPGFAAIAPVPEPSVALVGAIGALSLLRRRRI